ncbi:MAG: ABC transporter ATP-binding protein [Gammaproteobacteria bacterium]|nr:ABC transporter ATP-binding protein [Gammaproteobacteria bacterium]
MSLILKNIETFYGNSQALFGLSMEVARGSVTTLLGRNGMGKTTTVNSIIGNIPIRAGEIIYNDEQVSGLPAYQIAQKGVGLAPEGRQIFPNLNVCENLIATAANFGRGSTHWTLDTVLELFPPLKERLNNMGNQLSGGEQQMLAIGRALMLNPELLILDEATEGLAPLIRQDIWSKLAEIKQTGISILLIDKNLEELSKISDYHYIIEKGAIAWQGNNAELIAEPNLKSKYLGV